MKVYLNRFHKFLEDFDNRLLENNIKTPSHDEVKKLIKEWYSYDVEVDDIGATATVEMSEENYTLFILKYS